MSVSFKTITIKLGCDEIKSINIAQTIQENRKRKGITQNELSHFIGVSKASISKWETGQSYPDITLLPQLATFFDISIDELMGYKPQISKTEIRQLYLKLSNDFAQKPFDAVLTECQEIIKKYYSCYPLIFQMGLLLLNNCNLAVDPEKINELISQARTLFIKIKEESEDHDLIKQAIHMEAYALLALGNHQEVIHLLEDSNAIIMSSEIILASAYHMTGELDQAKQTLQIEIYQYFLTLLQLLQSYMPLFFNDDTHLDEIAERFIKIADAFNLEELHPSFLLPYYLTLAQGKMTIGQQEQAIDALENYSKLATGNIYPLKLQGDELFTDIEHWLETFPIGTHLPRDEKVVKLSMVEAVDNNPAFESLKEHIRFKNLLHKLKNNL